ncbi:MAG: hypothetical protein RL094_639 [Candidatus Parcubacteria bacterium]|jgi:putative ABC transport system permease protein
MNKTVLKVGFFLAFRQIKRANIWTTGLIIIVMALTFLNLVVVNGVLVGLIQGAIEANRAHYIGEVLVTSLKQKTYIENSQTIFDIAKSLKGVDAVTGRYIGSAKVNADYRRKLRDDEVPNAAGTTLVGIDPIAEDEVTGLSKFMIEGTYLDGNDTEGIMIGANLLYRFTPIDSSAFQSLRGIYVGDKLKITVGKNAKEVVVRGIIKSKVDENDFRVFMTASEARKLLGRTDNNLNEVSIRMIPGASESDVIAVKQIFLNNGLDEGANIQTYDEALPKFVKDMKSMFALLGNLIGSIGLAVASITIFIVIFVNTLTRRKFIGILKGIGIDSKAIEFSYILQSIFYALAGAIVGFVILYGFLKPFVDAHPINFPFSDGRIYAPLSGTFIRAAVLLFTTLIAGYIPARMIVNKNTLDSILGR